MAIVACSLLMKVLEKEGMWPTLIIQGRIATLETNVIYTIWCCRRFLRIIIVKLKVIVTKKNGRIAPLVVNFYHPSFIQSLN